MAFPATNFVSRAWLNAMLNGETHDLDVATIGVALYGPSADFAATDNLVHGSVAGELSGGGYSVVNLGNPTLTNVGDGVVLSDGSLIDQNSIEFTGLSAPAIHGALIFNATASNRVLAGISWQSAPRTVTAATFTIAPDPLNGFFKIGG